MLELTLTHMSIACLEIVFIDNSYMRMSYNMYNNFNNIIVFTAGTQDNYVFGRKKKTLPHHYLLAVFLVLVMELSALPRVLLAPLWLLKSCNAH